MVDVMRRLPAPASWGAIPTLCLLYVIPTGRVPACCQTLAAKPGVLQLKIEVPRYLGTWQACPGGQWRDERATRDMHD